MTLKDIAKILNLSEATVSRALNNHPKISQKTKDLVEKVAKENNFTKNTTAVKLATRKSYHIGLIFPDDFYEFNKRDFYSELEKFFLVNSEKTKYDILILRRNSLEKTINSGNVDGFIIINRDISKEDIQILEKYKKPYIFVAHKPTILKDRDVMVFKSDNISCGYIAAKTLIDGGCKNILTITSSNSKLKDYEDRTKGFLKYIEEEGIKKTGTSIYKCEMTFEDGRDLIKNNYKFLASYDGVFCQQDKVALGILSEAKNEGLNIPKDLKIIGHDDMEVIDYFYPRLTTIAQDFNGITSESLEYLINILENKEETTKKTQFQSRIISRETV